MRLLNSEILNIIESAPEKSGVYIFKCDDKYLYIGKAKNLRNRLRSYVDPKDERILKMIGEASQLEIITTDSERNAIYLEASLIRKYKPKYNIRLKSETPFYYIHITDEVYPRVVLTREPKDGGDNFGPYINRSQVRFFLKFARKLFPIRNCSLKLPSKKKHTPCIEYHIGRCSAPCRYEIYDQYKEMVKNFKRFLSGDVGEVAKYIFEKMNEEAKRLNFEAAAIWRDRLRSLNEFMVKRGRGEKELWAVYSIKNTSCVVLYSLKDGNIIETYKFLTSTSMYGDKGTLEEFLMIYYANNPKNVDEIIVPFSLEIDEINGIPIRTPKESEKEILKAAEMSARLEVENYIVKSQRVHPSLESLQKVLNLDKIPSIIEGFDISHTFGKYKVGSLVVFKNGKPFKSGYRRFKIKTVEGIDDYACMYEVVLRRYRRVVSEGGELPDLILIDGGIGQLNAALKALKELNLNIPTVALAKRFETLILPGNRVIQLSVNEPALKLLQYIRDESHRFALKYHRTLRSKESKKSALDAIPGIGEKRKKILLAHFGSISKIRGASVEEISSLPGFNRKVAETLKRYLG